MLNNSTESVQQVGAVVEVKNQDGVYQEATINKLTDASIYTVGESITNCPPPSPLTPLPKDSMFVYNENSYGFSFFSFTEALYLKLLQGTSSIVDSFKCPHPPALYAAQDSKTCVMCDVGLYK